MDNAVAVPGAAERCHTPITRRVVLQSAPTPEPLPPHFCTKEAEELSRLVLEEHGGGSLVFMHKRSLVGCVDSHQLASSSYARTRPRAISWLTKIFYEHNLRDEWMVAAVTLLDRFACVRPVRKAASSWKFKAQLDPEQETLTEWLGAVLCVLKMSSAEAELETMSLKDLIFQLGEFPRRSAVSQALWELVIKAEFGILRALEYNVAVPSSADLADRMALDVVAIAQRENPLWSGLYTERPPAPRPELTAPVPRFSLLVTFIVEFGLAHAQDVVYGRQIPPIVLALVAVRFALHAFGDAPPGGIVVLEEAKQQTLGEASCDVPLVEANLHRMWAAATATTSKIVSKWETRAAAAHWRHGPLPQAPAQPPCPNGEAQPPLKTPERTPRRRSPPPTTGPREPNPAAAKPASCMQSSAAVGAFKRELEAGGLPVQAVKRAKESTTCLGSDSITPLAQPLEYLQNIAAEVLPVKPEAAEKAVRQPFTDITTSVCNRVQPLEQKPQDSVLADMIPMACSRENASMRPFATKQVPKAPVARVPHVAPVAEPVKQGLRSVQISMMNMESPVAEPTPEAVPTAVLAPREPSVAISNGGLLKRLPFGRAPVPAQAPPLAPASSSAALRPNPLSVAPEAPVDPVKAPFRVDVDMLTKMRGDWHICSQTGSGKELGKAFIADVPENSTIQLFSQGGKVEPLKMVQDSDDNGLIRAIRSGGETYLQWGAGTRFGGLSWIEWKHAKEDKKVMWFRPGQRPQRPKRVLSPVAGEKAVSASAAVRVDSRGAKRRKSMASSSDSPSAARISNVPLKKANKENVTKNVAPVMQAFGGGRARNAKGAVKPRKRFPDSPECVLGQIVG